MTTLDDVLAEVRALRLDLARTQKAGKLLTPAEAAAYLDISLPTLRRWTREGKIKSRGKGRQPRYSIQDLGK